mgnify:FL=1
MPGQAKADERGVRRLSAYNLVSSMVSSAYSPYISFVGAVMNLPGPLLGLVSVAGTFFTNLSQYAASLTRYHPRTLVLAGNAIKVVALALLFFVTTQGAAYTALVSLIMVGSGVSGLGFSLYSEYYSRASRSAVLSRIWFYASLGSLPVIALGGVYMATNALLIKYVFLASAAATALSSLIILGLEYESTGLRSGRAWLSRRDLSRLSKFLAFNFAYMIVWSFAWPLFPLAQVYLFHMTTLQVAVINLISTASTIALIRPMGRFIARRLKLSLFIGRLTNTFFALAYAVSPNVYGIYASQLLAGVANSVNNVGFFSYLVDNSDDKRGAIGAYSVLMGVASLIGGEAGGLAYSILSERYGVEVLRPMFLYVAVARAAVASLFLLL